MYVTEDLLNIIAENFEDADIIQKRNYVYFKLNDRQYFIFPKGDKYIFGLILPFLWRLILIFLMVFILFLFQSKSNFFLLFLMVFVIYLIAILLMYKFYIKDIDHKVYQKLTQILDNPVDLHWQIKQVFKPKQ